MNKETEIKFKIEKKDNIVKRLKALGAVKGNSYTQTSCGFFSKDSIEKGIFPRIRTEDKKFVLTIKVKDINKKTSYFERDEYSLKIGNLKTGIKILALLGYDKVRKFTKKREHWIFKNRPISVTLDKLYFGRFLELEGSKREIEKMINDLGFEKKKRIAKAYLALEDEYKKGNKA